MRETGRGPLSRAGADVDYASRRKQLEQNGRQPLQTAAAFVDSGEKKVSVGGSVLNIKFIPCTLPNVTEKGCQYRTILLARWFC